MKVPVYGIGQKEPIYYVDAPDAEPRTVPIEAMAHKPAPIVGKSEHFMEVSTDQRVDVVYVNGRRFVPFDWQPIETAPQDGSHILGAECGEVESVHWVVDYRGQGAWWISHTDSEYYSPVNPTEWMPIPTPPTDPTRKE